MQTPRTHHTRVAGLAAWVALLIVALGLSTTWSDPRLTTPTLTDPAAWTAWAAAHDPAIMAMALLRLVLVALTWYLLGATTVQVAARLTTSLRLVRIANALSVPLVRRVVSTGLGVGLAATMVAAPAGTTPRPARGPASPAAPTWSATAFDPHAEGSAVDTPHRGQAAVPVMRRVPAAPSMAHSPTPPTMTHERDAATASPPQSSTELRADRRASRDGVPTWTVRSGDHLWRVAEHVLAVQLGRAPSDAQVVPYWQRLIEANRSRLPDPDNPDLVLPGLELVLPDPGLGA